MPYAPLDPKDVVILFADLQAGTLEHSGTLQPARLRVGVAGLAKLAHIFSIPVVVTATPSPSGQPEITPEIAAALGHVQTHVRTTTDAFLDPATRKAITGYKRKTLLISGVATEVIVQHSALSAVAAGYQAQVVVDACGGIVDRTEDAALRRMVHTGVILTSVVSVTGQLAGDFSTPKGKEALEVLWSVATA